MTTPAVSTDMYVTITSSAWARQGGCPGSFNHTNDNTLTRNRRLQETRPASVNNPKTRSGWRNPSAWSHSKLFQNPHPRGTVEYNSTGCPNLVGVSQRDGYFWAGGLTGSTVQAFPSYLAQVAVSRAILQLKRNRPNLAVAFAERKETERTFVDAAKSIAKGVRMFRNKNPKEWGQVVKHGAKNQFHGVPRKWLALQYGWKPLMSDIQSSANAISKREQDSHLYRMKVTGSSHEESNVYTLRNGANAIVRFLVRDKNSHSCKVILRYHLKNGALAAFSSMGLTNPLELGWERVPYSFVLDWFLPVGNWLSTLDADLGWEFDSGTKTQFSRLTSSSSVVYNTASYYSGLGIVPSSVRYSGETYFARGFNMTRSVYSSSPWAGFPSFKNPLSSTHIANAMSLLVEAFRR